jgi:plasmid stability protein
MTKSIQIRDVPDDIHRTLRARAAEAGMSLSDYLRAEIVRVAERPAIADVLQRAGERHGGVSPKEIVETIRSLRDERS